MTVFDFNSVVHWSHFFPPQRLAKDGHMNAGRTVFFATPRLSCPSTNSTSASNAIAAIDDCASFPASINFFAWPSRNSLIATACATSKRACEPCPAISITRAFAARSHAAPGRRQRAARLAYLQRLRSCPHRSRAQALCQRCFAVDLDQPAYAFDSTTIDLCLALFPWAKFRKRKGAVNYTR